MLLSTWVIIANGEDSITHRPTLVLTSSTLPSSPFVSMWIKRLTNRQELFCTGKDRDRYPVHGGEGGETRFFGGACSSFEGFPCSPVLFVAESDPLHALGLFVAESAQLLQVACLSDADSGMPWRWLHSPRRPPPRAAWTPGGCIAPPAPPRAWLISGVDGPRPLLVIVRTASTRRTT